LIDKKFDNEIGREMIILEEEVGNNTLLTNLFNFSFGIPKDAPTELNVFPQDIRIDLCADTLKKTLNID